MIQFAPHITALAGATLLINVSMTKADGWLNGLLFRIMPAAIGSAAIWMSSLLFIVGGAS